MSMRGKSEVQPDFLTVVNLNGCVPPAHPLRSIKRHVDLVLKQLSPLFDELYSKDGRPSIPPEQLLKARVLIALYSVRSQRLFCEQFGYNLLWLWFLDRELIKEASITVFPARITSVCSRRTWASCSLCMQ